MTSFSFFKSQSRFRVLSFSSSFLFLLLLTVSQWGAVRCADQATRTCELDAEGNCLDRECEDKHPDCPSWALKGECGRNSKYMLHHCTKSCNICDFTGNLDDLIRMRGDVELLETPYGKTQAHPEGPYDATRIEEIVQETAIYMDTKFYTQPQYAAVHHACKNMDRNCAHWKAMGECEANHIFMWINCSPVCQICHLMDYQTRCPSDPTIPLALPGPGDVNRLFEHITTNPEFNTKYNITIHSKPHDASTTTRDTDVRNINNDVPVHDDGPWIITVDDFLTDAEADRLIAIGAEEGYLNSIDFIADKASGNRTSKQTWCKGKCVEDATMQAVDARIEELLGISSQNFEYFQLLKYEQGEFYREHNDYNPVHLQKQTGVRILTVFLYLNTVEEGGGTSFPRLQHLTVTPTKGRVLIWPSVLDEDPNRQDDRTYHEALPVEKGVKYGANVWVHQRDYRKSYNYGCTY